MQHLWTCRKHDRMDRAALWIVLKIYGVVWQLLEGIKAFYWGANACVKVDGELSNSFGVGVRQGCVMSPWLVNIFIDRCMREMKAKVGKVGVRLKLNGMDWAVAACLFVDDSVTGKERKGTSESGRSIS